MSLLECLSSWLGLCLGRRKSSVKVFPSNTQSTEYTCFPPFRYVWRMLTASYRSMHESLFIDQTHEVLRLNGMKGNNPLVEVRTHDGSIRHGDCRWVDFAHMSRAWEVYQRDDGETFNPSIKSMIFLCHKAGKQTHKRW